MNWIERRIERTLDRFDRVMKRVEHDVADGVESALFDPASMIHEMHPDGVCADTDDD